jgi:hypothetical protein
LPHPLIGIAFALLAVVPVVGGEVAGDAEGGCSRT